MFANDRQTGTLYCLQIICKQLLFLQQMLFSIRALCSTPSRAPFAGSLPGTDKKEKEKAKEQEVICISAIDHNNTETEMTKKRLE